MNMWKGQTENKMKKIFLRGLEVPVTTNNLIRAKIDRLEWAIGAANYARESERVKKMVKKIAELKRQIEKGD